MNACDPDFSGRFPSLLLFQTWWISGAWLPVRTYQGSIHYKCPSCHMKLRLSARNWHCVATQLLERGFGNAYDCNELDFQLSSQQWGLYAKTFTSSHLLFLILSHSTPHLLCYLAGYYTGLGSSLHTRFKSETWPLTAGQIETWLFILRQCQFQLFSVC